MRNYRSPQDKYSKLARSGLYQKTVVCDGLDPRCQPPTLDCSKSKQIKAPSQPEKGSADRIRALELGQPYQRLPDDTSKVIYSSVRHQVQESFLAITYVDRWYAPDNHLTQKGWLSKIGKGR